MKTLPLLSLAALIMMSSCGKKSSSGGSAPKGVAEGHSTSIEAQELTGNYEAILRPLNTSVSGFIPSGRAKFSIDENKMKVHTHLEDDSHVKHIQAVYVGSRCPTLADDSNGDSMIDVVEMQKATSQALIPLDGDLSSQIEGQDFYPMGKTFTYEKSVEINPMFQDLYNKDLPGNSIFTKLEEGAPLNLAGKIVVIHGTADLSRVPESVQTIDNQPRNITIPIACGVIKRLGQ